MFTPEEREQLRAALVSTAQADPRITGAALVGSAAVDREDRWSDIDLALCLHEDADVDEVVRDWSDRLYRDHDVVHHLDVRNGKTLFRVFLLRDTLQLDLSFWAPADFGATGPTFRLLFGTAADVPKVGPPAALGLVGMGWLYALHARSSIARGRVWQAEYMVSGVRDHVLALACLRHGVSAVQGRGMDDLPAEVTAPLDEALVRGLGTAELVRAFGVTVEAFLAEVELVDAALAARIAPTMRALVDTSTPGPAVVSPA
ncbi:nucleotidyltransferase domain-containing protein [Actinosynnema pretiosum subsp. pretiosum]|uniref:Nucleotidyltransferase domain-containing protein n=1 Tax=Actinosynnema pretiosum subsp. pretiosum TaxID=103721 RepID=A0AA45L6C0_9PSEU|nr:nucleotidyltransferase domain-containing protein [Actinosynnema pretiosum subsp. pretiosum]